MVALLALTEESFEKLILKLPLVLGIDWNLLLKLLPVISEVFWVIFCSRFIYSIALLLPKFEVLFKEFGSLFWMLTCIGYKLKFLAVTSYGDYWFWFKASFGLNLNLAVTRAEVFISLVPAPIEIVMSSSNSESSLILEENPVNPKASFVLLVFPGAKMFALVFSWSLWIDPSFNLVPDSLPLPELLDKLVIEFKAEF